MATYRTINKEYELEDYNPSWNNKFLQIKKAIQNVFGDKLLSVQHVGSTSIKGMKAKPIIDVLVIVHNMHDIKNERIEMEKLGYSYKENYIAEESMFFCREKNGKRLENIHVFPVGHSKIDEFIDKRDYLKTHPQEIKRYERIKSMLIKQFPNDYISYRKGKDKYLNTELREKVVEWKRSQ
ncbi:hypothetical protein CL629_04155 [bacterium]|nr:hypothetical protein [bacterium]|tara:strand:- start:4247 stop:4789 length:543 start_codon:yes stop_codon:yes gene_type:complete